MFKACFGAALVFLLLFIKINFSSSMPVGVYIKQFYTTIERGDYVAVCLPEIIAREGRSQGYLANGFCPTITMPVIKQLIAIPGDEVIVSNDAIKVNQQEYVAPEQFQVKQHSFNHYQTATKQYWLYGSHNPVHSWDSRYFGGIEKENIQGVYKPVLVWKTLSKGDEQTVE